MLTFNIQLNADGVVVFRKTVAAKEAAIVGDWFEGKPYQPNEADVIAAIPYKYRKAFKRALGWWQQDSMSGRAIPLMCKLKTLKGESMGTLFATPNWVA
jgi:hypothetical protein